MCVHTKDPAAFGLVIKSAGFPKKGKASSIVALNLRNEYFKKLTVIIAACCLTRSIKLTSEHPLVGASDYLSVLDYLDL